MNSARAFLGLPSRRRVVRAVRLGVLWGIGYAIAGNLTLSGLAFPVTP